jgi:hypothetical protein
MSETPRRDGAATWAFWARREETCAALLPEHVPRFILIETTERHARN